MLKSLKFAGALLASVLLLASAGAQAQQVPATNQIVVSSTKTMDLLNARYVSITAGNQYIVDANGTQHAAAFPNVQAVTFAPAFANYIVYSPGVYVNLSKTISTDCVSSTSVISWANGTQTVLPDGCAFSDNVKAFARR